MRLPLYLKNGGAQWRTLIPAETQMYLAIYRSIDETLRLGADATTKDNSSVRTECMPTLARPLTFAAILSWLGQSLQPSGLLLGRTLY